MKKSMLILLFFAFISANYVQAQPRKNRKSKTSKNFTLQPLAKGVWAAINNDQYGRSICNAGIVDLGDKLLIFDAFMNPEAARELKDMAEEMTGKFVCMVVNSHFHSDHIRGNQVFSSEATIISTIFTRKEIERVEPEEQQWEEKHAAGLLQATKKRMSVASSFEKQELPHWIGYYEGMLESSRNPKMTLPNITFTDSLWVIGSERSVKLLECKNGHTKSDVILLIPGEGIAFMGDLLFTERHPWLSDGDPSSWQESLKMLYEDPLYTTYIPGHGPVGNKESLRQLYNYLQVMQEITQGATTDSLKLEVSQTPIPAPFQNWMFTRFYQPNLQYLVEKKSTGLLNRVKD